MTDLRKAAEMALSVLETNRLTVFWETNKDGPLANYSPYLIRLDRNDRAIAALRAALNVGGIPEHERQAVCAEHYASENEKPVEQTKEWATIKEEFHEWWHEDGLAKSNPFYSFDPAYWAFEGWHACATRKPNAPKQPDSFNELVRKVREIYGDAIILINQDELNVIHVKERNK
jgi:hypothetical protein